MPTLRLEGLDDVRSLIASLGPGLERANERAQNKQAFELMKAERDQARTDLNWPTPATISSILYKQYGATSLRFSNPPNTVALPGIPGAGVFVGDIISGNLATIDDVIGVQIEGGMPAGPKRSEQILQKNGYLRQNQMWRPAPGAKLDRYGNIPGPDWSAALTNLGFNQYAPPKQEKQWRIGGKPGDYRGIWRKIGETWQPWVWFITLPMYRPRYQWEERADMEIKANFESILSWYLDDELKKLSQ